MTGVLIEAARVADKIASDGALVSQLHVIHFVTSIGAISDVDLGLSLESIYPHTMTGIEGAVRCILAFRRICRRASTNGLEMFPGLIETTHDLTAVAIHNVNIAVGGDRDVG